jgi:uncharacterized iron-regulated protein
VAGFQTGSAWADGIRNLVLLAASALLIACAVPEADADDRDEDKPEKHPLIGSMWDSASADEISETELAARIAEARFILLGEKHDNPHHHVRQADLLTTASDNGRRPAVVWEMIAEGKRAVLKAFLEGSNASADGMGGVLNWKESGWPDWHLYQPIAAVALSRDLQQYPGNVDGPVVRNLARLGFDGLPDATSRALATNARWTEEDASALTVDLVDGHCGFMPESMIGPMGYVQRARDAVMAAALLEADVGDGAVLIAGNGHVRADRGVPRYLEPESRVLSIGILEALPGVLDWQAYLDGPGEFDIVIFTERVETPDRCEELRKRFGKNK